MLAPRFEAKADAKVQQKTETAKLSQTFFQEKQKFSHFITIRKPLHLIIYMRTLVFPSKNAKHIYEKVNEVEIQSQRAE